MQAHFGVAGIFAADPLAMAVAVEPGIVTRSERRHVTVELAGPSTHGQTTVDWFGFGGGTPNADVVLEVDGDRFWELHAGGRDRYAGRGTGGWLGADPQLPVTLGRPRHEAGGRAGSGGDQRVRGLSWSSPST